MRIKVFKAADLKEARAMVKDELGPDAVILHTKQYRQGGFLGIQSKEVVEVTAAVDDTPRRPRVKLPAMPRQSRQTPLAESEPPKPQMAARPRNVLSQYKTAGTEKGVSIARSQNQTALTDAEAFAPLAAEPLLRPAPTVQQTRRQSKTRSTRTPAPAPRMQPETEAPLEQARPNMEEWESALAAPILPRIEPEPIREAAPPKAETPKKGKARIIKAETLAAAKAKQEQEKAAEQEEELQEEEQSDAVSPSLTEASEEAAEQAEQESAPQSEKQKEKIHALEDELAQMRKMLRQVMDQSSSGEDVTTLKDALRAQELREDVMQDIIRKIPPATMMLGKDSAEAVKALGDYLHSVIKTGDGIGLKDGRPKIVALIGTTGVGKTTTIAKIAAKYVLERGVSVALVTADTYRISAVDQLRTYSDIIGLPLEIVYSPEELKPALRKHRDKKLILIDTAGRSQNNDYQMDELKEFLAVEPSIEKHLVLSATTKERDAEAILERFSVCRPDRILMTKTDETESIGFIVNLLFDRRLAMSYLTTGQSVPDDIEPAKPEALARLMLR